MMTSKKPKKRMFVKSQDNKMFTVSMEAAALAPNLLVLHNESEKPGKVVKLPLSSRIVQMLILWLEHHKDDEVVEENHNSNGGHGGNQPTTISQWDEELLCPFGKQSLFHIVQIAKVLEIPGLLKIASLTIADKHLTGKSPGQILGMFKLLPSY